MHQSRATSCSVRGSYEDVDVEALDNGEPEAVSWPRSRTIFCSLKDTTGVADVATSAEEWPPPPMEAAGGGGLA